MRNRSFREHRFEIVGLVPKDQVWFTLEAGLDSSLPASDSIAASPDEHDAHHSGTFVARRFCDASQGPCGEGGYIEARASAGGIGVVMFIPASTGTFTVRDPGNPDLSAKLVVF